LVRRSLPARVLLPLGVARPPADPGGLDPRGTRGFRPALPLLPRIPGEGLLRGAGYPALLGPGVSGRLRALAAGRAAAVGGRESASVLRAVHAANPGVAGGDRGRAVADLQRVRFVRQRP